METETREAKVIVFYGLSNDEAVKTMRAVKTALETKDGVAFAMTTPTNIEWPMGELVAHVWEEHIEMGKR
ncbi:MAG: hypothetical protein A3J97_01885 [Spirochaetes bacterium RIFOXYC1_FULL_54_7]|nr:MAG: hypothetical protein A3J97_01885 [Spirochaetes bacterium RIFOXYC1_FULL_54_7]